MRETNYFRLSATLLIVFLAVAGCSNSTLPDNGNGGELNEITWTAITDGKAFSATTKEIVFTFSENVTSLQAGDIDITNDSGELSTGTLSGSGKTWKIAVEVAQQGKVSIRITKAGIASAAYTVNVYKQYRIHAYSISTGTSFLFYYNTDGSIKQRDIYDRSGSLYSVSYFTNDTAGRFIKQEYMNFQSGTEELIEECIYNYEGDILTGGSSRARYWDEDEGEWSDFYNETFEYTYNEGKKVKAEYFDGEGEPSYRYTIVYDSSGKRRITKAEDWDGEEWVQWISYTRIYDSNGLLQFVMNYNTSGYSNTFRIFEWEPGETTFDYDVYFEY